VKPAAAGPGPNANLNSTWTGAAGGRGWSSGRWAKSAVAAHKESVIVVGRARTPFRTAAVKDSPPTF